MKSIFFIQAKLEKFKFFFAQYITPYEVTQSVTIGAPNRNAGLSLFD